MVRSIFKIGDCEIQMIQTCSIRTSQVTQALPGIILETLEYFFYHADIFFPPKNRQKNFVQGVFIYLFIPLQIID